jgi:hypothetical protein
MIQVRVGENDRVDIGGLERERLLIMALVLPAALEKSALDQDAMPVDVNEKARAGDLPGCSIELDTHKNSPLKG